MVLAGFSSGCTGSGASTGSPRHKTPLILMKNISVVIKEKFLSELVLYIPKYLDKYVQKNCVYFSSIIPPH